MKTRMIKSLFTIACLLCSIQMLAYDFQVDGICYDISDSDNSACYVTYKDYVNEEYNCHNEYEGMVIIPEKVVYQDKTYKVTGIKNNAFRNCDKLTDIVIPEGITSIGDYAFNGCTSLYSVIVPNSVKSIGTAAFASCSLESVVIGSGVTSVSGLFGTYSGTIVQSRPAKMIWLPNTPPNGYKLTYNGYYSCMGYVNYVANDNYKLSGCQIHVYDHLSSLFESEGIVYVPVNPSERTCDIIDCSYSDKAEAINIRNVTSYKGIDMNVVGINPYAFYRNHHIKSLTIDFDGGIPKGAFSGCTNIPEVKIDSQITYISSSAFSGCSSLINATIENTGYIAENAFKGSFCNGPATVIIKSKGDIGSSAFSGCSSLINATIENNGNIAENAFEGSFRNGPATVIIKSKGNIGSSAFFGCSSLINATIENNGYIAEKAFKWSFCKEPATVIIKSKGSIGGSAFSECSSLVNATIENNGNIGSNAFYNCESLSSINLRNNGSVGDNAFKGCYSASSLRIAPTVTSIGDYAFSGCSKMGDVTIEDRDTDLKLGSNGASPMFSDCPLDEVYIGGKIVYNTSSSYGYSPFYRNTSLRKVTITDKETAIYDNEFYGCTGLKEVVIGDGVTSFGKYAFSGCSAIESFEFGAHVETIGEEAFSDCTAMTKMISHNPIPPVCGTEALDDINKWECTLYVPDMAIDTYKAADQWKNFFFVENYIPTGIDSATVTDKEKTEVARYDMGGNRVTENYKGVVIIRYADGTRTKVLNTGR